MAAPSVSRWMAIIEQMNENRICNASPLKKRSRIEYVHFGTNSSAKLRIGLVSNRDQTVDKADSANKRQNVDSIPADDAHKAEKVTKLGREHMDPDEGSD